MMMLHRFSRMLGVIFLCAALLFVMPTGAMAKEQIDLTQPASVTVHFSVGENPVSGMEFRLYRVAEIAPDGTLSLTGAFEGYPVALEYADQADLCLTLAGFALQTGIKADETAVTDDNGAALFDGLVPSVYLLMGQDCVIDGVTYLAEPALLQLPYWDGSSYVYEVSSLPKSSMLEDSEYVSIQVVWEDGGFESGRPEQVQIDLVDAVSRQIYDTIVVSVSDSWRYTWDNLPEGHSWYVAGKVLPGGYTVLISQYGNTFVLSLFMAKDTPPTEPGTPDQPTEPTLPQTGTLKWLVPVLAVSGLVLFSIGWVWRRRDEQA